jgi:hypothetical protein
VREGCDVCVRGVMCARAALNATGGMVYESGEEYVIRTLYTVD